MSENFEEDIYYNEVLMENIEFLEKELDRFEKSVKNIWLIKVLPYINNPNRKILNNLTENDYNKFLLFMTQNSPVHKKIEEKLKMLNKYKHY